MSVWWEWRSTRLETTVKLAPDAQSFLNAEIVTFRSYLNHILQLLISMSEEIDLNCVVIMIQVIEWIHLGVVRIVRSSLQVIFSVMCRTGCLLQLVLLLLLCCVCRVCCWLQSSLVSLNSNTYSEFCVDTLDLNDKSVFCYRYLFELWYLSHACRSVVWKWCRFIT